MAIIGNIPYFQTNPFGSMMFNIVVTLDSGEQEAPHCDTDVAVPCCTIGTATYHVDDEPPELLTQAVPG